MKSIEKIMDGLTPAEADELIAKVIAEAQAIRTDVASNQGLEERERKLSDALDDLARGLPDVREFAKKVAQAAQKAKADIIKGRKVK